MPAIKLEKRLRIYERDGFTCQDCGFKTTRERVLELLEAARRNDGRFPLDELLTIDHRVPTSRGGSNDESNLQTLCFPCNNRKGDRLPADAPRPRKTKKQRPVDPPRLRLGQPKPLGTLGERVQHLPGCCPVAGCVGNCPVPNLGFLIGAVENDRSLAQRPARLRE